MVGMPMVFPASPLPRNIVLNTIETPKLAARAEAAVKSHKPRRKGDTHHQSQLLRTAAGPVENSHKTQLAQQRSRKGSDWSLPSSDFFTFSSQVDMHAT
eukprot:4542505-Amphidinium_carterae.1